MRLIETQGSRVRESQFPRALGSGCAVDVLRRCELASQRVSPDSPVAFYGICEISTPDDPAPRQSSRWQLHFSGVFPKMRGHSVHRPSGFTNQIQVTKLD